MGIPQLNFGGTSVVDPTRGALQGVTAARNTLASTMKQWSDEEELDRQRARQKVLDDRATSEYDYKLAERAKAADEATSKQNYLNALSDPGQMMADKNVQRSLMSPEVMGQVVNNNPILDKAATSGIESLTPEEKVKYEEHFKQMDALGNMKTKQMGALDAADLYGVMGGEYATTESIKAKQALELARNTGLADLDKQETNMAIEQLKAAQKAAGSSSSSSSGKLRTADGTPLKDKGEVLTKTQTYLEKKYAQDSKNGSLAKPVSKLNEHMAALGYSTPQIAKATEEYYKKEDKPFYQFWDSKDNFVVPPDKSITDLVGEPANVATSTGYSATDKKYDDKIAAVSKEHLDTARDKIENRGVDKPTRELFDSILNNTYGSTADTETLSKVEQKAKTKGSKVGGQIGEAINTKGAGGELARLTVNNPKQFAKEYELLKPPERARVDGILKSDASNDYFNSIKEIPGKSIKANGEKNGAAYDEINTKLLKEFKEIEKDSSLSPMEKAAKKLQLRTAYGVSNFSEGSLEVMRGLDNAGTYIGNLFRPENAPKPYMSKEDAVNAAANTHLPDFLTGNTEAQKASRARVKASLTSPKKERAKLDKVLEDKYINNMVNELGITKKEAIKIRKDMLKNSANSNNRLIDFADKRSYLSNPR